MENSAQDLQLRELRDTIKELNKLVVTLNNTIGEMTAERDRYREEAEYFKKKLFGTSSESVISRMFLASSVSTSLTKLKLSLPSHLPYRKKIWKTMLRLILFLAGKSVNGRQPRKKSSRAAVSKKSISISRMIRRIAPSVAPLMVPIGEEFVRREISFVPAKVKVTEYYSRNYECPKCRKDAELPTIVKGRDFHIHMLHGMASASTVAWVMFQKYFNGMPLPPGSQLERAWDRYLQDNDG